MSNQYTNTTTERPPVIVVMGHVDHGKSALIDYIRKSNVVAGEAGGITQHINAYEISHKHEGDDKRITFIDTPGHAAFSAMRARGAGVADIAILVVSAKDGVKTQTLEALNSIKSADIPYVVAINKIDLPDADITKTQSSLIENEVYIEGMGGDIPWVAVSAKTGEGIDELLDTILLVAEMEQFTGNPNKRATGIIIESHRDNKRGVAATLIIKDGTLTTNQYVVSEISIAPVRIMEDFTGEKITQATFSSPIALVGFDELPNVGARFITYDTKKDASLACQANKKASSINRIVETDDGKFVMPVVLKADTSGSAEAIESELKKLNNDYVTVRVIESTIGNVGETDIKTALAKKEAVVIGFNVVTDALAVEAANQHHTIIKTFSIIYELTDWLEAHINEVRPKVEVEQVIGQAKTLALFSATKKIKTIGGKVIDGNMQAGAQVHILSNNDTLKGDGKIISLQHGKSAADTVNIDQEFGTQIETEVDIIIGDKIKCVKQAMV